MNHALNHDAVADRSSSYRGQPPGSRSVSGAGGGGDAENPAGIGIPGSNNLTSSSRFIPFQHRNTSQPFSRQTPQETRNWIVQVCKQVRIT